MAVRFSMVRSIGFMLFGSSLFFTQSASAALVYFDPNGADVYRGDTVTVSLRIDTDEDECINTVSGVVHYDPSIIAIDVSRGNSILNLWVEEPKIDAVNHTIAFAGGLPGGYCGRIPGDPSLTNTLFQIVFQSPGLQIGGGADSASARVWLESPEVLLHDGQATPAAVRTEESTLNLLPTSGGTPQDAWRETVLADNEPPADFAVTLTKDETAFSGKYFISFNTSDKQSGIDHFEVMEEPFKDFALFRWGRADAPWHITESPYVLADQTLNSTILVKALDKAGNERVVRLVPDEALRGMSQGTLIAVLGIAAFIIAAGAVAAYIMWRRRDGSTSSL